MDIGTIILGSVMAVSKLYIIGAAGFYLSHRNILTTPASQIMSKIIFHIGIPCLLFVNLVVAIDSGLGDTIALIFSIAGIHYIILAGLGLLLRWLLRPPATFRNGVIASTMFGNTGDLVFAIVLTVGEMMPFLPGDTERGMAFISLYLVVGNAVTFTLGDYLIAKDYEYLPLDQQSSHTLNSPEKLPDDRPRLEESEEPDRHQEMDEEEQMEDVQLEPLSGRQSVDDEVKFTSPPTSPSHRYHAWRRGRSGSAFPFLLKSISSMNLSASSAAAKYPWIKQIYNIIRALITPPNIAVIFGLIIGSVAALKGLFVPIDDASNASGMPPLKFLYDTLKMMGDIAVPMGILNLGATLEKLRKRTRPPGSVPVVSLARLSVVKSLAIALAKMLVMPLFGLLIIYLVYVFGFVTMPEDRMLLFVLWLESSVPTATSTVTLAQIRGGDGSDYGIVLAVEYSIATLLLSAEITAVLAILSTNFS